LRRPARIEIAQQLDAHARRPERLQVRRDGLRGRARVAGRLRLEEAADLVGHLHELRRLIVLHVASGKLWVALKEEKEAQRSR